MGVEGFSAASCHISGSGVRTELVSGSFSKKSKDFKCGSDNCNRVDKAEMTMASDSSVLVMLTMLLMR